VKAPEHQYTVRAFREDVARVDRIRKALARQQVIAPKDSDLYRAIFHEGIVALELRLGLGEATGVTNDGDSTKENE
jgi:hypothetical protein